MLTRTTNQRQRLNLTALILLWSLGSLLMLSCQRDNIDPERSSDTKRKERFDRDHLVKKFELSGVKRGLTDTLNSTLIVQYVPLWDEIEYVHSNDSVAATKVPLRVTVWKEGQEYPSQELNNVPFLYILSDDQFYLGRFFGKEDIPMSAYKDFLTNGKLTLQELSSRNTIMYSYSEGKGSHTPVAQTKLTIKSSQKKSGWNVHCYEMVTCTWSALCDGMIYLGTSHPGTCNPPPPTPCDYSSYWEQGPSQFQRICEDIYVPDPPPGGGGGLPQQPGQPATNADSEPASYYWRNLLANGYHDVLERTTPMFTIIEGSDVDVLIPNENAYNCHYHTFISTDPSSITGTEAARGNPRWVTQINLKNWTEVSSGIKVGDVVIYQAPGLNGAPVGLAHSGIVTQVNSQGHATEISSKMGEYQVIHHHPRDVPSAFGPTEPTFQYQGETYRSRLYFRK